MTRFKPRLGFVDHIDPAFAAHDTTVAVTLLKRAERVSDLHGPLLISRRDMRHWLNCTLTGVDGGRYWVRTSDPYDVNVVLYR